MTPPQKIRRPARGFRDLTTWQEANALARTALTLADRMPRGHTFLADQLRRAATSIPLNIAEGNGKPTRREYLRFLSIARGSLNEVEAIVELLRGNPRVPATLMDTLLLQLGRTSRLLAALMQSLHPSP